MKYILMILELIGEGVLWICNPKALKSPKVVPDEQTMLASDGHRFSNYEKYSPSAVVFSRHDDGPMGDAQ